MKNTLKNALSLTPDETLDKDQILKEFSSIVLPSDQPPMLPSPSNKKLKLENIKSDNKEELNNLPKSNQQLVKI